jgi:hypothetical protein
MDPAAEAQLGEPMGKGKRKTTKPAWTRDFHM